MREIKKAIVVPQLNGWLLCEFDNGVKKFVDIKPSMNGVLDKLRKPEFFEKVFIDHDAGTVCWPNDLHIDPDTLFNRGIETREIERLWQAKQYAIENKWLEQA